MTYLKPSENDSIAAMDMPDSESAESRKRRQVKRRLDELMEQRRLKRDLEDDDFDDW